MAGLAAYFLSLADLPQFQGLVDVSSPQKLKDYMIELSYPRGPNADLRVFSMASVALISAVWMPLAP